MSEHVASARPGRPARRLLVALLGLLGFLLPPGASGPLPSALTALGEAAVREAVAPSTGAAAQSPTRGLTIVAVTGHHAEAPGCSGNAATAPPPPVAPPAQHAWAERNTCARSVPARIAPGVPQGRAPPSTQGF